MRPHSYTFGVLLVITGGLFLSGNGILLRHIEQADGWQILYYRGLAFSLALFLILLIKYRRATPTAFTAIGWHGLCAALALGLSSGFYVFALISTTIANAMFIMGTAPLATAFVAWLLLRERVPRSSIISMLVALLGIVVMISGDLNGGRWFGNLMALGVVAGFVIYLLSLRGARNIDMLPATCLAGLVMSAVGFLGAEDLILGRKDLIICLIMGCLLLSVGFICYTIATRYILAAEVALYGLTESILAPIWVWIGVGEVPGQQSLLGCALVLASVTAYSVLEVARNRKVPQPRLKAEG